MHKSLILELIVVGAVLIVFTGGEPLVKSEDDVVQEAINEATTRYNERLIKATRNGAQSFRKEINKSSGYSRNQGKISNIYQDAYKSLISSGKMDRATALDKLRQALPDECQIRNITCNPEEKYRSINGSCNNLENTLWGSTGLPSGRVLPAVYEGELHDPRGGKDQPKLPSARTLSVKLHSGDGSKMETTVTHMIAQFGQFLDHDITLTPVDSFSCCDDSTLSADCWSIAVEPNDPFYKDGRAKTCLDFVRSTSHCSDPNAREQMNAITAFIDGSVVYGSDETIHRVLRKGIDGQLTENSEHKGILPWKTDVNIPGGGKSIIAGDVRADEMPGLATLQSLFLREHNRIAGELGKLQKKWNDETLFQETRRIVAAELQQIAYNEFLPAVLSPAKMSEYKLQLPNDPTEHTNYDSTIDPRIFNSFAAAAYRFGHSLVNGLIKLYLSNTETGSYHVRENYGNVAQIIKIHPNGKAGFDLILNGLIRQSAQAFDAEIDGDLTNYLFAKVEDMSTMIGHDLAARNIQRGRDHGLPSYNEFRKYCKLEALSSWDKTPKEISAQSWAKLKDAYQDLTVDDIDLYSGGLSEEPLKDSVSGPTFTCLMAKQFKRLMDGDRFFFTHQNQTGSFTKEQLAVLRKRTFGDIICQNSDIDETQKNIFSIHNAETNPMIKCNDPSRELNVTLLAGRIDSENGAATLTSFTTFYLSLVVIISSALSIY